LSKRRDALRRGIRSLIHDTSRELADLEGREMPREVSGAGAPGGPATVGNASAMDEARPLADPGVRSLEEEDARTAGDAGDDGILDAEVMAVEVREIAARGPIAPAPGLGPRAAPAEERDVPGPVEAAAGSADAASRVDAPGRETEEPVRVTPAPDVPEQAIGVGLGAASAEGPAGAEPAQAAGAPARKRPPRAASKKTAKGAAARRRRPARVPAADALDGVDPAQAQSRKGVCVAYFVDHACWHVTNAYCNTALHVCVMRDCPVYHLHRDALERRFAGKYKHFW